MSNQISENAFGSYFDYYEQETNNIFNSYKTIAQTGAATVTLSFLIPYTGGYGTRWDCTVVGENITATSAVTSGYEYQASGGCYTMTVSPFTVGFYQPTPAVSGLNLGSGASIALAVPTIAAGAAGTNSLVITLTGLAATTINWTVQMKFIPSAI